MYAVLQAQQYLLLRLSSRVQRGSSQSPLGWRDSIQTRYLRSGSQDFPLTQVGQSFLWKMVKLNPWTNLIEEKNYWYWFLWSPLWPVLGWKSVSHLPDQRSSLAGHRQFKHFPLTDHLRLSRCSLGLLKGMLGFCMLRLLRVLGEISKKCLF